MDEPCRWPGSSSKARKAIFPQDLHCALLDQVQPLLPQSAQVVVLGDGEFDGTSLRALLRGFGWQYVCRTAPNLLMNVYGGERQIGAMAPVRGELLAVRPAWMTAEQYGPVSFLAIWESAYEEPIYLVTNMLDLDADLAAYRKRAHIETFCSDQKSRGFQVDKSHLSHPKRLTRLLIASCPAYIWLVYLGVCALRGGWLQRLHRQDRCDLSLFRLGVRLLARCLKDHIRIPDGLLLPAIFPRKPLHKVLKHAA